MPSTKRATESPIDQLISQLEPYFTDKAPLQLPKEWHTAIADYAWIVSLVVGLFSLPAVFALLGMMTGVGMIAAGVGIVLGPMYWLAGIALMIQVGLMLLAVPGLKAKSYSKGWKIVFYGELFSAAHSLLSFNPFSWISSLVGLVIGLWILFQIKRHFR